MPTLTYATYTHPWYRGAGTTTVEDSANYPRMPPPLFGSPPAPTTAPQPAPPDTRPLDPRPLITRVEHPNPRAVQRARRNNPLFRGMSKFFDRAITWDGVKLVFAPLQARVSTRHPSERRVAEWVKPLDDVKSYCYGCYFFRRSNCRTYDYACKMYDAGLHTMAHFEGCEMCRASNRFDGIHGRWIKATGTAVFSPEKNRYATLYNRAGVSLT